jgi:hypothetical protein
MLRLCSIVVLVLVLAACGDDDEAVRSEGGVAESSTTSSGAPASEPADGELPFGLQRCSSDPVFVSAPEDWYRAEPMYGGNEMPVEEVRAWAAEQPGFEGIWIDRDHNGWVSVAFSRDAEARQADLEERFPGVGVVAVPVEWTEAELVALRDQAFGAMEDAGFQVGGSHGVHTGLVEVWVGELVEERLAPLAPFAGPRLCVTGVEPEDVIRPAPQPESGEGWRLLGTDRTGDSYRTGVATTDEQYAALWTQAGLGGEPPAVDFDDEVVIWFGAVYGSGCEIRMDDVVFDQERRIVHGDFVIPGVHQGCNDDANPEAYVVAVERSALPAAPFDVQLDADDPPAGAPEERTTVDVDLHSPGATIPD